MLPPTHFLTLNHTREGWTAIVKYGTRAMACAVHTSTHATEQEARDAGQAALARVQQPSRQTFRVAGAGRLMGR